ncbi:unnamed protein product, partial [Meganyctiphanes norvegica]
EDENNLVTLDNLDNRKSRNCVQQAMPQAVNREGGNKGRKTLAMLKPFNKLNYSIVPGRKGSRIISKNLKQQKIQNSLEILRRRKLKKAFEEVRSRVPALQNEDCSRLSKVKILKNAAEFCKLITKQNHYKLQECEELRKYQQELKRKKDALGQQ